MLLANASSTTTGQELIRMKILIYFYIAVLLTGCSARTAFESIQAGNRYQCSKLPPTQYDDCIASTEKSYDEYDLERKESQKSQL